MKRLDRRAASYCRRVAGKLPFGGRRKREYLRSLRADVRGYLSNHPWAEPEELAEAFGTPERIAAAFLSEMDDAELYRRVHLRRRVIRLVLLGLGLALLLLTAALAYMILRNRQDMDGHFIVTQSRRLLTGGIGL